MIGQAFYIPAIVVKVAVFELTSSEQRLFQLANTLMHGCDLAVFFYIPAIVVKVAVFELTSSEQRLFQLANTLTHGCD